MALVPPVNDVAQVVAGYCVNEFFSGLQSNYWGRPCVVVLL